MTDNRVSDFKNWGNKPDLSDEPETICEELAKIKNMISVLTKGNMETYTPLEIHRYLGVVEALLEGVENRFEKLSDRIPELED